MGRYNHVTLFPNGNMISENFYECMYAHVYTQNTKNYHFHVSALRKVIRLIRWSKINNCGNQTNSPSNSHSNIVEQIYNSILEKKAGNSEWSDVYSVDKLAIFENSVESFSRSQQYVMLLILFDTLDKNDIMPRGSMIAYDCVLTTRLRDVFETIWNV